MIRPININLNAAHPELPLVEATTFTGAPSSVFIRGVPPNCGRWAITAVFVAASFPDGSTTTRAAVQSANGVWVATLPATATSGRTANGVRIMADGIDENGEAVTGYILGVADFAVASLDVTPAPEPGETSYQMLYFDAVPSVLHKCDVAKIDGVLKFYNGTAWEPFAAPVTLDDAVTRTSANGVKSSGIWSALWGALSALPTGFTSLYDWCVAQLAGKVPTSRTVNSKALTTDITIGDADITYTGYGSEYYPTVKASLDMCIQVVASLPSPSDILYTDGSGNVAKNGQAVDDLTIGSHPAAKLQSYDSKVPDDILAFDSDGNLTNSGWTAGDLARYALTTKTISNNAVTLDDRAINAVAVSSALASLTINFPTATSGKARDFGLRLTVASGITTAPELALPQGVTCENADGEAPEIGADGAATILYFTETASGVFLVKGEVVTAIS